MFKTKKSIRRTILNNLSEDFDTYGIEYTDKNRVDYLIATLQGELLFPNMTPGRTAKVRRVLGELIEEISGR
jgi:hypothetical protein